MAIKGGGRREHRGPLMVKLSAEVERFRDRPFLKAAMAVSALSAQADGDVSLEERYRIDAILEREPILSGFDTGKAISIFRRIHPCVAYRARSVAAHLDGQD